MGKNVFVQSDDCVLYCSIIYCLMLVYIFYKEVFIGYKDNCFVEYVEF